MADQIQQPRPKNISGRTVTADYDASDIGAYEVQSFPTNQSTLVILESVADNEITISWPAAPAGTCLTLQQTPSLVPAQWTTVTNPVNVSGNQCQVTISPLPLVSNMFYRLYHP